MVKTLKRKRTDLKPPDWDGFRDDVKNGATRVEMLELHPRIMRAYPNAYDNFKEIFHPGLNDLDNKKVILHIGDSGTGKTTLITDTHEPNEIYKFTSNIWFGRYENQKILLIDNFDGHNVDSDKYIIWTDKFEFYGQKNKKNEGSFVTVSAETIYVTSTKHPREWFKKSGGLEEGEYGSVIRRFSKVRLFYKGKKKHSFIEMNNDEDATREEQAVFEEWAENGIPPYEYTLKMNKVIERKTNRKRFA